MKYIIETIIEKFAPDFAKHFIAENPEKLRKIYEYYAAFYELNPFPLQKM